MPRIFHPRRSDAHRIACLSLYRALFKQCSELTSHVSSPESLSPLTALRHLIRYRFRRDRLLQSPYAIQNALRRGHSHLQTLHDATTGSPPALSTLISVLKSTEDHASSAASARTTQRTQTKPPPKRKLAKIQHIRNEATKAMGVRGPDSVPLSALPLPLEKLKQPRRKVPYLNEAQGRLALLRWPGQHRFSVFVSRVMRYKLKRVERLHEKRMDLEVGVHLGRWEDEWEGVVRRQIIKERGAMDGKVVGVFVEEDDRLSWAMEARASLDEQDRAIKKMEFERGDRGRYLWEIVKKEKKLSDWETLPEKLVRAGITARKMDYLLIALARRRGNEALADRVWKRLSRRKEVETKQEAELMAMYWVISVERRLSNFAQSVPPDNDSDSGRRPAFRFTNQPRENNFRRLDIDPRVAPSHPRRDRTVTAFRKALDPVKLVDFDKKDGGLRRDKP